MTQFARPISATFTKTNDPILLVAMRDDGLLLGVEPAGQLKWFDASELAADYQFDWGRLEWIDMSPWSIEDAEASQEDDRSESVQGYVPDADGTGDGDQGDEADHDPGDVDTSQDDTQ